MKIPAVQVTRIKGRERDVEEVKNNSVSLTVMINEYKYSLKNNETKPEPGERKSLFLGRELKRIEQGYMILHKEKCFLRNSTQEVISDGFAEHQGGLKFTDAVILAVEIEFLGLALELSRAFFP